MTLGSPPLYGHPGSLSCDVVNVLAVIKWDVFLELDCSAGLEDVSVRLKVQMWSCAISLVDHVLHVFVEQRVSLVLVWPGTP